jgi:hypothetical protein
MSDILPRLSGSVIGTSAVAESTPKKRSYMAPIVDVHRSRAGQYDSGPDVQITAGQRFRRRRDRRDQTDVGNISDQPRKSTRKKRSHPVSPVEPSAREPFENYIAPSETAPTTGAAPGPDAGN